MIMDPGEIAREYTAAANPKKQISILAELNECTEKEIQDILMEKGVIKGRKKAAETQIMAQGGDKRGGRREAAGTEKKATTNLVVTKHPITDPDVGADTERTAPVAPECLIKLVRDRLGQLAEEAAEMNRRFIENCTETEQLKNWLEKHENRSEWETI